jgi:hypothetical protein
MSHTNYMLTYKSIYSTAHIKLEFTKMTIRTKAEYCRIFTSNCFYKIGPWSLSLTSYPLTLWGNLKQSWADNKNLFFG